MLKCRMIPLYEVACNCRGCSDEATSFGSVAYMYGKGATRREARSSRLAQ
jgi:hypothetical protein